MTTNHLKHPLTIIISFLAISLFLFINTTEAASCHSIKSSGQTPSGFASPVSYLTNQQMIKGDCAGGAINVEVGNNSPLTYVYNTSYQWTGDGWEVVPLEGENPQGAWYPEQATGEYTTTNDPSWYVAYTCEWVNNSWKCGCTSSACTSNNWQIQAFVPPPVVPTAPGGGVGSGGGSAGAESKPIPEAIRTVPVSSSGALNSAISNAQPGDHIVLANGSYSGFTVSKSGTGDRPIVLRSDNLHGARVMEGISLNGDHVFLAGLDLGSNQITVSGSDNRVTRNYFRNSSNSGVYLNKGSMRAEVDHNELEGGAGHNGSETADAIMARPVCDIEENHYVHHNYLHSISTNVNADALSSGYGNTCDGESVFEYNLVEGWGLGKSCIYEKGGENIWRYNTCVGAGISNRGTSVQRRGLTRNSYEANWIDNDRMNIFGGENRVIGNQVSGGINLGCGTVDIGQRHTDGVSPHYYAATNNLVTGNTATIRLGTLYAKSCDYKPAQNNRIEANQGSIDRGFETGTVVNNTTSVSIPQAFKLTPSQVGPNAPTAPGL